MTSPRDPAELVNRVEKLALRHTALREEVQRVQTAEALTRTRLTQAWAQALIGEAQARAEAGAAAMRAYRAVARERPARRNRIKRRLDIALGRLGAVGAALIIARSGLWTGDALSTVLAYTRRRPDPAIQPAALFDQAWYLAAYPDVASGSMAPLAHYIAHGGREGRTPHPLLDVNFYTMRNRADLDRTGLSPLEHFVHIGAARGCDPHPLFRIDHYVAQAPDLAESGENPLTHYLRDGWRRDLNPHPLFDGVQYRANTSPGEAETPALIHYLTLGSRQGRKPHRLFDPVWYRQQYPDVADGGFEALTHYVTAGGGEGRYPGPWFDAPRYIGLRGDQLRRDVDPLTDYLQGGAWTVAEPILTEAADLRLTPLEHWAARADAS